MAYLETRDKYAQFGVDTESALEKLAGKAISIHCWQGDDVTGFDGGGLGGGIQSTGNYPGKARNFEEIKSDFLKACSLIPGKKRINLHASYAVNCSVDRNLIDYSHFAPWVEFARENHFGIDFNPTCFGHKMVKDGLTLSSTDKNVRDFWIEHCKRSRKIADEIGRELGDYVLCNLWIPDGLKDIPADRLSPRIRLKCSLDEIFAESFPHVIDSVESKVFGIGLESYTVGSNEFYMGYAASRKGVYNLLDNGHFHPTENVADKISSLLCYFDIIPLHITRSVRWDSDHVVLFDDETRGICSEIVRNNAMGKVLIGLDFFDGSINRIAAWVIGTRSVQKALLSALLQPDEKLREMQDAGDFSRKLALAEEFKTMPFADVWIEYLRRQNVAENWYPEVEEYEKSVLAGRV
ncbi:MAG: L-rhamnose isomerase [Synergistaceae bacterium]|nr:L-rhamnose isomerase [Synergistaceae bacterium]